MNTEAPRLNVQRDALASALIRFIEMTGGPDGMGTGSGADPRDVRKQALEALAMAGVAYPLQHDVEVVLDGVVLG